MILGGYREVQKDTERYRLYYGIQGDTWEREIKGDTGGYRGTQRDTW